jgi:hypothetical protein
MSIGRGLGVSVLAAAVGAGAWVGLYAATGWSVGVLAIVIGGLAGWGMAAGNRGRGGAAAGVLAAVVVLVGVCAARVGVAQLWAAEMLSEDMAVTEEDAEMAFAPEIYAQFEADEIEMSEPEDDAEYPPEVMAAAARRWRLMGDLEREEFIAALQAQRQQEAATAEPMLMGLAFVFSFGIGGLVCLGLGMSTAYKIGSTVVEKAPHAGEAGITVEAVGPVSMNSGVFSRLGPPGESSSASQRRDQAA